MISRATGQPDRPPLDVRMITGGLAGEAATWSVEVLEEAVSTNAVLLERARSGAPEGLVVAAEHQSAGRGRLDRSWVAPPRAGLTFSVLLRPREVPAARWPWLPMLAGLAVVEGITAASGPPCALKWPNDVIRDDYKLGGLLVERSETAGGPVAVVGIGINVTTLRRELPVPEATSLLLEGLVGPDRDLLLAGVLDALASRQARWRAGDPDLREAYAARCTTLGRRVRVQVPAGPPVEGTAVGVEEDGALLLETAAGRVTVRAGDVVHVRLTS